MAAMAGIVARKNAVQCFNGFSASWSQIQGIIIDIKIDMLTHDRFVHFLRVAPYERGEVRVLGESVLQTFEDEGVHMVLYRIADRSADGDTTQWNGHLHSGFPVLTEVGDLFQSTLMISEAVLMDEYTQIALAIDHRVFNSGEKHEAFIHGFRIGEIEQQMRRGVQSR